MLDIKCFLAMTGARVLKYMAVNIAANLKLFLLDTKADFAILVVLNMPLIELILCLLKWLTVFTGIVFLLFLNSLEFILVYTKLFAGSQLFPPPNKNSLKFIIQGNKKHTKIFT